MFTYLLPVNQLQVYTILSAEWLSTEDFPLACLLQCKICSELRCTTVDEASPRVQPIKTQITGKTENSTVYTTLLHWNIWHKSNSQSLKTIWMWIMCINSLHTLWSKIKATENNMTSNNDLNRNKKKSHNVLYIW